MEKIFSKRFKQQKEMEKQTKIYQELRWKKKKKNIIDTFVFIILF